MLAVVASTWLIHSGAALAAPSPYTVVAGTPVNLPCQPYTPTPPDAQTGLPPGQQVVSRDTSSELDFDPLGSGQWLPVASSTPGAGSPEAGQACGAPPYTVTQPGLYRVRQYAGQETATGPPEGTSPDDWALDTSYSSQGIVEDQVIATFRVVPKCPDQQLNGIASVTDVDTGQPLSASERATAGLAGDLGGDGQTWTSPPGRRMKVTFRDGASVIVGKGASLTTHCLTALQQKLDDLSVVLSPKVVLGKIWSVVVNTIGSDVEVQLPEAATHNVSSSQRGATDVAGILAAARGTEYTVTWQPGSHRTTVRVSHGVVAFLNTAGRRHTILVHAGQTGVQVGHAAPRLLRGKR